LPDVGELMLASFPSNSSIDFVDADSWFFFCFVFVFVFFSFVFVVVCLDSVGGWERNMTVLGSVGIPNYRLCI
jgi:hypothetical protein